MAIDALKSKLKLSNSFDTNKSVIDHPPISFKMLKKMPHPTDFAL